MKTFDCTCGNTLFFENSKCLSCNKEVCWCPICYDLTPLLVLNNGGYQCGQCQSLLKKCFNFITYNVCNRCVDASLYIENNPLCDYCLYNDTIPDLNVPGNLEKWYELEISKRRLLYTLELVKLPIHDTQPPLSFDFKGDVLLKDILWRTVGTLKHVYTGHANGKITINIREADPVTREKVRVDLNESHRTLVGHFHHEIGHFYWELLVKNDWLQRFNQLFGDHTNPGYADALEVYYKNGAPKNWKINYVSAYATMHPWEDFAETFAAYLDMVSVLDTASHLIIKNEEVDVARSNFHSMMTKYTKIGIVLNEMNRTIGLIDFLPDIFSPNVITKLEFVHDLIRCHAV